MFLNIVYLAFEHKIWWLNGNRNSFIVIICENIFYWHWTVNSEQRDDKYKAKSLFFHLISRIPHNICVYVQIFAMHLCSSHIILCWWPFDMWNCMFRSTIIIHVGPRFRQNENQTEQNISNRVPFWYLIFSTSHLILCILYCSLQVLDGPFSFQEWL